MTTTEFILLLISSGIAIKTLDWIGAGVKEWLAKRRADKSSESQTALDLKRLDAMSALDLSNVSRENFQVLMLAATEMAKAATDRARTAVEERDAEKKHREKCESDLKSDIDNLKKQVQHSNEEIGKAKGEHRACSIVLEQVERNLRFLFDNFSIAYWEVEYSGRCVVNQTFAQITGLKADQCSNDGWLTAVHADDRSRVEYLWKNFKDNYQTHCLFDFRFVNVVSSQITFVTVECNAIMLNGLEVHKYTARTKPLNPAN